MLSLAIFLPAFGLLAVILTPKDRVEILRLIALGAAGLTLLILVGLWFAFEVRQPGFQFVEYVPWIETMGVGYQVGLDGLSLVLVLMTALLFLCTLAFSWPETHRAKEYYAWFLFLETACLGVFAALDLFLFYVFWDLTLVGMYFIIAIWGHEGARAAALKFFLYTFVGSIALLLGIIGLYLSGDPLTTDMTVLIAEQRLTGGGWLAHLAFWGVFIGLAVKTPMVPLHTWLPPAHGEAPAAGSAILAGVLLKMGTYGLLRILFQMLPETLAFYAPLIIAIGVIGAIYGALVALAQTNLKWLIAYTSINHMGYVVMAVGAAALVAGTGAQGFGLAVNGAVLQMVSHGLITAALFLFAGVLWRRAGTFALDAFGGLAKVAPVFAGAMALAAFASLGLPGLSGFVAEFQMFVGTFSIRPLPAALALVGIVITAGLFLWALQRLFLGELDRRWAGIGDMTISERLGIFPLLAFVVLIGVLPFWILGVIDGFSASLDASMTAVVGATALR